MGDSMNKKESISREMIAYLLCGVITTLCNYIVYFLLRRYTNVPLVLANVLAFIVAVTQAFFTNKYFVYRRMSSQLTIIIQEFISFVSLRVVSMGLETLLLVILVEKLHLWEMGSKLAVSVLVVILNYLFGKFITFRRRGVQC